MLIYLGTTSGLSVERSRLLQKAGEGSEPEVTHCSSCLLLPSGWAFVCKNRLVQRAIDLQ